MLALFLLSTGISQLQPQREQLGCLSKPQPLCYVIDFSLSVFRRGYLHERRPTRDSSILVAEGRSLDQRAGEEGTGWVSFYASITRLRLWENL